MKYKVLPNVNQDINISDYLENNIDVKDYAQGKKVLELCNHPEQLTDDEFIGYNGQLGYCGTHHPTYLTIDLDKSCNVGLIQFLLFDPEEDYNHGPNERKYHFRVLVADDYISEKKVVDKDTIKWKVLYDSCHKGVRNWQIIHIQNGIQTRFIRIHCMYNQKNAGFHIVRLRVYCKEVASEINYELLQNAINKIDNNNLAQIIHINANTLVTEIGDGFPLSKRLYDLANLTSQISSKNKRYLQFNIEDKYFKGINYAVTSVLESKRKDSNKINIDGEDINNIFTSIANDMQIMERNSDGMKRIILDPVSITLTKGYKSDKNITYWSLGIAILSFAMTILSLIRVLIK